MPSTKSVRKAKKARRKGTRAYPPPADSPDAKQPSPGKRGAAKAKDTKVSPRGAKSASGQMSGLDAAASVLAKAKEPMRCRDLVEAVLQRRLWSTTGKTPGATLHAAMIREIAGKGKASRFRKVGRGLFASNGKGA